MQVLKKSYFRIWNQLVNTKYEIFALMNEVLTGAANLVWVSKYLLVQCAFLGCFISMESPDDLHAKKSTQIECLCTESALDYWITEYTIKILNFLLLRAH